MKNSIFAIFLILTFFISCKSKTRPNKLSEFTEAWNHYSNPSDSLKRKALKYLIKHIDNKKGLSQKAGNQLEPQYSALYKASKSDTFNFEKAYNNQAYSEEILPDTSQITSDLLIENIDYAFKVKDLPWAKESNFEDFCEYILPYRIREEPLSNWRKYFYDLQKPFIDSLLEANVTDPKIVAKILSDKLQKHYVFYSKLNLPLISLEKFYQAPIGDCTPRYILFTAMARSIGLPVAIDFTPQYSSFPGNHECVSLISSIDSVRSYPFNAGEIWKYFPFHGVKMFRYTFKNNHNVNNDSELLSTPTILDVTKEYPQVVKDLELPYPKKLTNEPIYLFTFTTGENLVLLAEGQIKKNKIIFKDLCYAESSVLLMGYYDGNEVITIRNPFTIQNWSNEIHWNEPSGKIIKSIKLTRKYPVTSDELPYYEATIGAKIQGANKKDFSDSTTLLTIEKYPTYFKQFEVKSKKGYNYYRYFLSNKNEINLAELQFDFGEKENSESKYFSNFGNKVEDYKNIIDNNIKTNLSLKKNSWIGVDRSNFSEKNLKSIKILPRNSFNSIEVGHKYELYYFDKKWKLLGQQIAESPILFFENIPENILFLLKDKTVGNQERIFTYNYTNEQIFW